MLSPIGQNSSATPASPRGPVAPAPANDAPAAPADQVQIGVHTHDLPDGGRITRADNGLCRKDDAGAHTLRLPSGEQIVWTDSVGAVGTGADGAFSVQSFPDKEGKNTGFGFTRDDGSTVTVNTQDYSVAYRDQAGTILQNLDAQGGEFIIANSPAGCGKQPDSRQLYLTPQGQVQLLSGSSDGLQVSQGGISFDTPEGWTMSAPFPESLPGNPTGQFAAPLPAPPPQPVTPPAPTPQPVAAPQPVVAAPQPAPTTTQFPVVTPQPQPTVYPTSYAPPPSTAPVIGNPYLYQTAPPPYGYPPLGYPPYGYPPYGAPPPFANLDFELHHERERWDHYRPPEGNYHHHF